MANNQDEVIDFLPKHLKSFVTYQDYNQYTTIDHAVWRYIMRQNLNHLRVYAHQVYLEGLEKTGITLEYIPSIDEMNRCLSKIGWKAVVVSGFIPPSVFMELQALKVLAIAVDMRTYEHILYTPAPDIVHESAGHAPFIVDEEYSEFLQKFGEIGVKAMYTKKDSDVYEAIRHLSIVKEYPNATEADIKDAVSKLEKAMTENTSVSESSLLSRLHWWTVEYGLVGDVDDYKIFGAGLLSSLGESKTCIDDQKVKKIPLTIDCVDYAYDITNSQPQLFVARNCRHLTQVLLDFEESMCYKKGGAESVQIAIDSEIVSTAVYSSGLQVSGVFGKLLKNAVGTEIFISTKSPTQLSFNDTELEGHGVSCHKDGFSSPVGRLQGIMKPLEELTIGELHDFHIKENQFVKLNFLSGVSVRGELKKIHRKNNKNIMLTFENCTVNDSSGTILFDPNWGVYDMALGERIVSVFSGPADRSKYEIHKHKSNQDSLKVEYNDSQTKLFDIYKTIRESREGNVSIEKEFDKIYEAIKKDYPKDWLVRIELLELLEKDTKMYNEIRSELIKLAKFSKENNQLIMMGIALLENKSEMEIA
jgi:phenylalanine-4-hydroxylase